MSELVEKLKMAEIGYKEALRALPYMPVGARAYTLQTAEQYAKDIILFKRLLEQEGG